MSKPLANCKTYVEGKGWIDNWEFNRTEPKAKTVKEQIEDIFQFTLKANIAKAKENDKHEIKVGLETAEELEERRLYRKYG